VWQSLLKDMDSTPAPPKFATNDVAIREQLPKGIADLTTMVAAAKNTDQNGRLNAAMAYVHDMVPTVTDALHDIDPVWPKE